jgi:hypothetical protein
MSRIARQLLFLGALFVLALPTPAFASADQVIRDCAEDGKLDRNYSNAELRRARNNLPSDLDEYSDCRDVIASAIKGGSDLGGNSGSPGVGGTDPAGEAAARASDAAELGALAQGGGESPKLDVGGANIEPDDSGFFNLNGAANEVPLPLLLALLLLCALAVASGVGSLRERVPAIGRVPLLSKIPSWRVPFIGRRS